ncbi:MAG: hypothetical protein GY909_08100 [Oligoflexia bacterium]|nr:hypothetical protein [Oligoflexia bacterium]
MFDFLRKKKITKTPTKNIRYQVWVRFKENPQHQWIFNNSYIKRSFQLFLEKLDSRGLKFLNENKVNFVYTNGLYSCTLTKTDESFNIIVFPQLVKLFQSANPEVGVAILAHELGHLLHHHYERQIAPQTAQIEADQYAIDIGLINQLETFLRDFSDHPDCDYRLRSLEKQKSQ